MTVTTSVQTQPALAEVGTAEPADLIIIGAGPGGYVGAVRAAQLGASVVLVEARELGGTCLNRGCIPSKALLHGAEMVEMIRAGREFGIQAEVSEIDYARMVQRKDRVVAQLRKGVEFLMESNNIRVVAGQGRLVDNHTVAVCSADGEELVSARKILIATGSAPARIPIPGVDLPGVITSDEAVDLKELPRRAVIVGGGYIGAEFAYLFAALGAEVSVFEMLDHLLPLEDPELAAELARAFRKRRIKVHAPARVKEIRANGAEKVVSYEAEGKAGEVAADLVLLAVGRLPLVEGLGAEELGIEFDRRFIKVNSRLETSVPDVYACGDVVGGMQLAHKASAEAKVAVVNALGGQAEMDYRAIPSCVFTSPEVASVGLKEQEARQRGLDIRVGRFPFRASGKAVAIGERDGLVKLIADARNGAVLGAHMVGPRVSDLIAEATLAVRLGTSAEALGETVHAHPTLAEAVMEATEDALGHAIHK